LIYKDFFTITGGSGVIRITSIHAGYRGSFIKYPHPFPHQEKCASDTANTKAKHIITRLWHSAAFTNNHQP